MLEVEECVCDFGRLWARLLVSKSVSCSLDSLSKSDQFKLDVWYTVRSLMVTCSDRLVMGKVSSEGRSTVLPQ